MQGKTMQDRALAIAERKTNELEGRDEEYCGVNVTVEEDGVEFYSNELDIDHMIEIALALLDELKLDEAFFFSWADTCSRDRLNSFGGGACALKRGELPFWVDAMDLAREHFKR